MVRHVCDEIAVMYLGRVVERGPYQAVLDNARHPYMRARRGGPCREVEHNRATTVRAA